MIRSKAHTHVQFNVIRTTHFPFPFLAISLFPNTERNGNKGSRSKTIQFSKHWHNLQTKSIQSKHTIDTKRKQNRDASLSEFVVFPNKKIARDTIYTHPLVIRAGNKLMLCIKLLYHPWKATSNNSIHTHTTHDGRAVERLLMCLLVVGTCIHTKWIAITCSISVPVWTAT